MPHAVWEFSTTGATDLQEQARQLIPGVQPGMGIRNIFAQQRTKPALLIQNAWVELDGAVAGANTANVALVRLKLSQDTDLAPGLLLPVAGIRVGRATAASFFTQVVEQVGHFLQGTMWAPRFVGIQVLLENASNFSLLDGRIHLDYEVVDVPWETWFIMWDFLDGVSDNTFEW